MQTDGIKHFLRRIFPLNYRYPLVISIGNRNGFTVKQASDRAVQWVVILAGVMAILSGCTPTVQVEAPREPITINLNVRLDADVRLRLIEEAQEDVEENPIF